MSTDKLWKNLLNGADEAGRTVVFSGGTCNVITAGGDNARNTARDALNTWLDGKEIPFFDPQIHVDTHGMGYDYDVHGPAEQAARGAAQVTVYEIGPDTIGSVSCLEAVRDAFSGKQVVLWFSGDAEVFDDRGRPAFQPAIDLGVLTGSLAGLHLGQYVKRGSDSRKNVMAFVSDLPNVTIVRSESDAIDAIDGLLNS